MQRPGNARAPRKKLIVAAARLGEGTPGEVRLETGSKSRPGMSTKPG